MLVITDGFCRSVSSPSRFSCSSTISSIIRTHLVCIRNVVVPKELVMFPLSMFWRSGIVRFRTREAWIWTRSIPIRSICLRRWIKSKIWKMKRHSPEEITNIHHSMRKMSQSLFAVRRNFKKILLRQMKI